MAGDFKTAAFRGKKGNTFKLVKKKKKTGAMAQPRYNGFRVISDRVITALQCIWLTYKSDSIHKYMYQ